MAKKRKYKGKNKRDLLDRKITTRVTVDDKCTLTAIRNREGTSMAEVIRTALHGYYAKDFNR